MLKKTLFLALVVATLPIAVIHAQNKPTPAPTLPAHFLKNPPGGGYVKTTPAGVRFMVYSPVDEFGSTIQEQPYFWWVNEPWNGNDKPYVKVRQSIDVVVRKGAKPADLVMRFHQELNKDPWNPVIVFKWAYASWLAQKGVVSWEQSEVFLEPVGKYMPQVKFPRSYQFARLAFLVQSHGRACYALKNVGEKLLKRNSKDEEVKYAFISVLLSGRTKMTDLGLKKFYNKRDDNRAMRILSDFQHRYSNEKKYDLKHAFVMEGFWRRQYPLSSRRADIAKNSYYSYLKKYPKTSDRNWVILQIKDITTQQENWEMWGAKNKAKEDILIREKARVYYEEERKRREHNAALN